MAVLAVLPDPLPDPAVATLDQRHVIPPQGVVLLLVVAEPAPVQTVTARGLGGEWWLYWLVDIGVMKYSQA